MTAHTAEQIIEAMARTLQPVAWASFPYVGMDVEAAKSHARLQARAVYAECLRMLRPPSAWQEGAVNDMIDATGVDDWPAAWIAAIDARIKELG